MYTKKVVYASKKTNMLQGFNMEDCNISWFLVEVSINLMKESIEKQVAPTLFKHLVGSLKYLCNTKPDISFGVGLVSRHMENPKHSHLFVAKRILRYVKETKELDLLFIDNDSYNQGGIIDFSDSDWYGDKDDKKVLIK